MSANASLLHQSVFGLFLLFVEHTSHWLRKVSTGTLLYLETAVAEAYLQVQCAHLEDNLPSQSYSLLR